MDSAKRPKSAGKAPLGRTAELPQIWRTLAGRSQLVLGAFLLALSLAAVPLFGTCYYATYGACSSAGRRNASQQAGCGLGSWIRLGACKSNRLSSKCNEAYVSWFNDGCLCDHAAYPKRFLPADASVIGFVHSLMEHGLSYDAIAAQSECLETFEDCLAPVEGAFRLDRYGTRAETQTLQVIRHGSWRVAASVDPVERGVADALCRLLGSRNGTVGVELPRLRWDARTMAYLEPASSFAAVLDAHRDPGAAPRVRTAAPPVVLGRATIVQPITLKCLDLIKPEVEVDELRPAGCFVDADGEHVCQIDGVDIEPLTADRAERDPEPTWPSMACGTLGSQFLSEGNLGSELACARRQAATRRRCGARLGGALLLGLAGALLLSGVWTQLATLRARDGGDEPAAEPLPPSNVALELQLAAVAVPTSAAQPFSHKSTLRGRMLERAHAYWQTKPSGAVGRAQRQSSSQRLRPAPAQQPATMQLR